jgi:hypothetical protein
VALASCSLSNFFSARLDRFNGCYLRPDPVLRPPGRIQSHDDGNELNPEFSLSFEMISKDPSFS